MGHGGMTCGMKTMRFFMVAFNIIFFIIGLALIGLGIYVMVDPSLKKIKEILPINSNPGVEKGLSYLEVMGIVLLVIGSVIFFIGFMGCCGAMKQIKLFLIIYAVVVGIIILVEVAVIIYFVAFRSKFREQITPKLVDTVRNTYEGPLGLMSNSSQSKPQAISIAWDFIMYNLRCCGVNNGSDFNDAKKWNRTNPWWTPSMDNATQSFKYPLTCCNIGDVFTKDWNQLPLDQMRNASYCAATGSGLYPEGCFDKVLGLIDTAKTWVIIGAVVILVIELAAFIFAVALCCRKKKKSTYYSS